MLEQAIVADFGLVRAWKGDRHGNLVFRDSARNFNPLAAMCGRVTIAEVEELVEPGELDPDDVHMPGVYVQRVVALTPEQAADKRIEKRTVRPREPPRRPQDGRHGDESWTREEMAARAAAELTDGVLRQPRHRAADPGAELRRRRRRARAAVARTASSASAPTRTRARRTPT